MVDAAQPLRHSHVVGILRLELKLEKAPVSCPQKASTVARQAAVGGNPQKCFVSVGDQPETNVVVFQGRFRRAKNGSDKIVVQVWRSHGELRLLQTENPVVMPGGLLEHGKRDRVPRSDAVVGFACQTCPRKQVRMEQSTRGFLWFEGPDAAQDFAAIVSRHPYGRDLAELSRLDRDRGHAPHPRIRPSR